MKKDAGGTPKAPGILQSLGTIAASSGEEAVLAALDAEQGQEERVEKEQGSFFEDAPDGATMVTRAREFDDIHKHWVRRQLWLKVVKRIVAEKQSGIRLLTLPGQNRFEIRLYEKELLLGRNNADRGQLSVVGFEDDPGRFGLLITEVPPLLATLLGDVLEALAQPTSSNGRVLREHAPYDVINLDLTGNIAKKNDGPYPPFLRGVRECFQIQGAQVGPWALMVTFRAGMSETDPGVVGKLEGFFEQNLRSHLKVKEACFDRYGVDTARAIIESKEEEALGQFTAKWIIEQGHSFEWSCASFRHASYTRPFMKDGATQRYSLRKLIFVFEKRASGKQAMPLMQVPPQSWHADDLARLFEQAAVVDVDKEVEGLAPGFRAILEKEIEELRDT